MHEGVEHKLSSTSVVQDIEYSRLPIPLAKAAWYNFLGDNREWFKAFIILSMVFNTIIAFAVGKSIASLFLLIEFIFTLIMSIDCYPLESGGLLVVHAIIIGLTSVDRVFDVIARNLNVILLLIFLVSCIHFLRNVLLFIFTQLLLNVENKIILSVLFLLTSAGISAFLDALTVSSIVVSVCTGLLAIYYHVVKNRKLPLINEERRGSVVYQLYPKIQKKISKERLTEKQVEQLLDDGIDPRQHPPARLRSVGSEDDYIENALNSPREAMNQDSEIGKEKGNPLDDFKMPSLREVIEERIEAPIMVGPGGQITPAHENLEKDMARFRAFLRSLLMYAAIGTAVGGITTKVGEPQNLIVADVVGWDFPTFVVKMLPVWAVVIPAAVVLTIILESLPRSHFGYGSRMPDSAREILRDFAKSEYGRMEAHEFANMTVQIAGSILLILGLIFQVAEVGLVGLTVIILITSFNGIIIEHEIAEAFEVTMPFVTLVVVYFAVMAILEENFLFDPLIDAVLSVDAKYQPGVMFLLNGAFSIFSDNVFVASIFIDQIAVAKNAVNSTLSDAQFERFAVAVVSGTVLSSIATPNGQFAFLFILTSNLAPIVGLSYRKMTLMAAPYTVVLVITGFLAVIFLT